MPSRRHVLRTVGATLAASGVGALAGCGALRPQNETADAVVRTDDGPLVAGTVYPGPIESRPRDTWAAGFEPDGTKRFQRRFPSDRWAGSDEVYGARPFDGGAVIYGLTGHTEEPDHRCLLHAVDGSGRTRWRYSDDTYAFATAAPNGERVIAGLVRQRYDATPRSAIVELDAAGTVQRRVDLPDRAVLAVRPGPDDRTVVGGHLTPPSRSVRAVPWLAAVDLSTGTLTWEQRFTALPLANLTVSQLERVDGGVRGLATHAGDVDPIQGVQDVRSRPAFLGASADGEGPWTHRLPTLDVRAVASTPTPSVGPRHGWARRWFAGATHRPTGRLTTLFPGEGNTAVVTFDADRGLARTTTVPEVGHGVGAFGPDILAVGSRGVGEDDRDAWIARVQPGGDTMWATTLTVGED